jgi:hypothetical protein
LVESPFPALGSGRLHLSKDPARLDPDDEHDKVLIFSDFRSGCGIVFAKGAKKSIK